MIICKIGNLAYCGDTPNDAYGRMLESDDDYGELLPPEKLEWFTATPMKLKMSIEPLTKAATKPVKK